MTDQNQPMKQDNNQQPAQDDDNKMMGVSQRPLAQDPTNDSDLSEPAPSTYQPIQADTDNGTKKKSKLDSNLPDHNTPVMADEEMVEDAFSSTREFLDSMGLYNAQLRELAQSVKQNKKGIFLGLKGGGEMFFQEIQDQYGRPTEFIGLSGIKMDDGANFGNAILLMQTARDKGWNSMDVHGSTKVKDAMWLANYQINQKYEAENEKIRAENKNLPPEQQKPEHRTLKIDNHRPSDGVLARWDKEGKMAKPEAPSDDPAISNSKFMDTAGTKPETTQITTDLPVADKKEQEDFMTQVGQDIEQLKESGKSEHEVAEERELLNGLHDRLQSGNRIDKESFEQAQTAYGNGNIEQAKRFAGIGPAQEKKTVPTSTLKQSAGQSAGRVAPKAGVGGNTPSTPKMQAPTPNAPAPKGPS
jgi:hypothetical protein